MPSMIPAFANHDSPPPRRLPRSVLAMLGGLFAGVILSLGTDMVLRAAGIFPPWGQRMTGEQFLLATAYRTVYCVVSSYIAARLAPYRPMQHALLLGAFNLAVNIAGTVATWNRGPEFGPKWYPLSLVLLAMPCAWLGGFWALTKRATVGRVPPT